MEPASLLPEVLSNLLRELVDGPPGQVAFILNPGDRGLFASLAELSAAQASTRINGRSSVAAHVQHLRFGLHLLNRWAGGDANAFADATYAESWSHQQVNDTEWRELREAFEREVREWRARLETPTVRMGRDDAERLRQQRRPHRLPHGRDSPARTGGGRPAGQGLKDRH